MSFSVTFNAERNRFIGFYNGKRIADRASVPSLENIMSQKLGMQVKFTDVPSVPQVPVKVARPEKVLNAPIRSWLIELTEKSIKNARAVFGIDVPMPKVEFYSVGCHAGRAFYTANRIQYNEVLASQNRSTFEETVKHEVAHLVSVLRFGLMRGKGHGAEFFDTYHKLGGSRTIRYHTYDVSSVKKKRTVFVWKCNCPGVEHHLSPKKHERAKHASKLNRFMVCRKCRSSLYSIGETKKA